MLLEVDNNKDYRKSISQFFINKKLIPLSIQKDETTLEDAFITITQNMTENIAMRKTRNEY